MITPLGERTTSEHARNSDRILLVPIGSFEQHGPHLPLTTDTQVAIAVCTDVALNNDVDIAPALPYSASGEHAGFAGLLSLGTEVTASLLTELIRSARGSWRGIVVVSGHGGNAEALERVARCADYEGDLVRVWLPSEVGGDPHAGATETSVMMTIAPDQVGELPEGVALKDDWLLVARREGVAGVSPSGVLGKPQLASTDQGWMTRRRWCGEVEALVREIRGGV
ncbi:MAG: mycofactocin biosynthesis peptidyl-dipeptidase MftE [Actinomycetota bacterium]